MLIFPLAGLLYFSVNIISQKNNVSSEMKTLSKLVELSEEVGALIHETQKERGNSAGYLSSNGTEFGAELKKQQTLTDNAIQILNKTISNIKVENYGSDFNTLLEKSVANLENITSKRKAILNQNIDMSNALGYYTSMNKDFLNLIGFISTKSTNSDISNHLSTYVNFLKAKEQSGIERAILTNTFLADSFNVDEFNKFSALVTTQDNYLDVFLTSASNEQRSFYKEKMATPEVLKVQEMRAIVFEKASVGGFDVNAKYWFETMTKKIENLIANNVRIKTAELQATATKELITTIVLVSFIVIIAITIAVIIAKEIIGQLGGEPREVIAIAALISNGDLTYSFNKNEEATGLYAAIKSMTLQLQQIMGNITTASVQIAVASGEMTGYSQKMSEGANEQASSTEEVSATMEQISASFEQNTKWPPVPKKMLQKQPKILKRAARL